MMRYLYARRATSAVGGTRTEAEHGVCHWCELTCSQPTRHHLGPSPFLSSEPGLAEPPGSSVRAEAG